MATQDAKIRVTLDTATAKKQLRELKEERDKVAEGRADRGTVGPVGAGTRRDVTKSDGPNILERRDARQGGSGFGFFEGVGAGRIASRGLGVAGLGRIAGTVGRFGSVAGIALAIKKGLEFSIRFADSPAQVNGLSSFLKLANPAINPNQTIMRGALPLSTFDTQELAIDTLKSEITMLRDQVSKVLSVIPSMFAGIKNADQARRSLNLLDVGVNFSEFTHMRQIFENIDYRERILQDRIERYKDRKQMQNFVDLALSSVFGERAG